jgi:hypothetical protein
MKFLEVEKKHGDEIRIFRRKHVGEKKKKIFSGVW